MVELPEHLHELLEEAPLIVEDHPSPKLLAELGMDRSADRHSLCGLHSGLALTERQVDGPPAQLPQQLMLFREPIMHLARSIQRGPEELRRQIHITLLHEIGHHFGLDEDELEELGFG